MADQGGNSALVTGLNLGSIPISQDGDHTRQVTFQVVVDAAACGGTVQASATVDSSETEPVAVGPAVTNVVAAALDTPLKTVTLLSPPPAGPNSVLSYTITITNAGGQSASGITLTDELPPEFAVISVITDGNFVRIGNSLTVSNLSVAAGGATEVVIIGRVLSVGEFAAIGVAENDIDSLTVINQATLNDGCSGPQLSDDPTLAGTEDPTPIVLTYRPDLATSSKSATDESGAPLEPDDFITFTVDVINTGNRAAEVIVTDSIPANTTYVPNSTLVDGVPAADIAGTSPLVSGLSLGILSFVGDVDRSISFRVQVDTNVANGTSIQNTAALSVPAAPSADRVVSSVPMVVVAAPDWSTSTKSVSSQAEYRPGDTVDLHPRPAQHRQSGRDLSRRCRHPATGGELCVRLRECRGFGQCHHLECGLGAAGYEPQSHAAGVDSPAPWTMAPW